MSNRVPACSRAAMLKAPEVRLFGNAGTVDVAAREDAGTPLPRQFYRDLGFRAALTLDRERSTVQFGQSLGNTQSKTEALLFLHLAIELHVSADFGDMFGF